VAAYLLDRVDESGMIRFVGETAEDRREMFKVARLLPRDVEVEIFEDPRLPGLTFLEVRLMAEPPQAEPAFRVVRPNRAVG
jgi:hypothetical protein